MPADEIIKVKLPQLQPFEGVAQPNDKIFLYDESDGILKHADVSQLPFTDGGGGGGGDVTPAASASFKVRTTSTLNPKYEYDAESNNVIITDLRLIGKTDYPVRSTQTLGGDFRDDSLEYNPDDGKVIIKNFRLDTIEHITIDVNTIGNDTYTDLMNDIAELKRQQAPFTPTPTGPNFGAVWFRGDLATLAGTGWQECVEMRGLIPMGKKTSDEDYNKTIGTTIGSKVFKIDSIDKLPKHRFFSVVNQDASGDSFPYEIGRMISNIRSMIKSWAKPGSGKESYYLYGSTEDNIEPTLSPTNYLGKETPDDIKHIPECLIGHWIEYVGIE
jgi:hypothetical protein